MRRNALLPDACSSQGLGWALKGAIKLVHMHGSVSGDLSTSFLDSRTCIYIYIQTCVREREGEGEGEKERDTHTHIYIYVYII